MLRREARYSPRWTLAKGFPILTANARKQAPYRPVVGKPGHSHARAALMIAAPRLCYPQAASILAPDASPDAGCTRRVRQRGRAQTRPFHFLRHPIHRRFQQRGLVVVQTERLRLGLRGVG